MATRTYDFKKVAVIVNGRQITGFADGTAVKVARAADAFELEIGADGEGVRSKSNNHSGSVTFSLQQAADANIILSAIAAADELSNAGVVALMIKDNSGNSLHVCEQAWVKKIPDAEYQKKSGALEWVFETDKLITFLGGN